MARVAMKEAEQSAGKVMILVGAMLLTCLGWLAYSRWISPVDVSSADSGSALPVRTTSNAGFNSSQGKGGTAATLFRRHAYQG